jgi:hypothetical protein
MLKQIIFSCLFGLYAMTAFAGNNNDKKAEVVQIVPLVQFESLNLSSQQIRSNSAGFMINREDLMFTGVYTQHRFGEPLQHGFPRLYHSIDMLLDVKNERHQYLGIFKSASDQPVCGGINTYQAAAVYGYEMINRPNLSLVLGGGLAVGNFGVETSDGKNWPLIPVPLLRMNHHTDWLDTSFEFITSPNLSFILAPKGNVRLCGDFRMDQSRDARDLIYEVALSYHPYSEQDERGDFVGISIGFKNDNYGEFNLGNQGEDETLEVHYKSLFAAVDVSVLKFTAGYAFDGRALYRGTEKQDLGEGYYASVQAMYPF